MACCPKALLRARPLHFNQCARRSLSGTQSRPSSTVATKVASKIPMRTLQPATLDSLETTSRTFTRDPKPTRAKRKRETGSLSGGVTGSPGTTGSHTLMKLDNEYMQVIGKRLNVQNYEDWYAVTTTQFLALIKDERNLGSFNSSLITALQQLHPEFTWYPWRFRESPLGFWKKKENIIAYVEWIGCRYGVQRFCDWYHFQHSKLSDARERAKIKSVLNTGVFRSFSDIVRRTYPEFCWRCSEFSPIKNGFWEKDDHVISFFDRLGARFGVRTLEDWYKITVDNISEVPGGDNLIRKHFGGSLALTLKKVYPFFLWENTKFHRTPNFHFSESIDTLLKYIPEISENLGISKLDDWYRVSQIQLKRLRILRGVQKYGGLYQVLSKIYPENNWDSRLFLTGPKKKSVQWRLLVFVKQMFPNAEVLEEYTIEHSKFSSLRPITLDIYVPTLNLAIEYQGEHHFKSSIFFGEKNPNRSARDREKEKICEELGINLFVVPFWWDHSLNTLKEIGLPHLNSAPIAHPEIQEKMEFSIVFWERLIHFFHVTRQRKENLMTKFVNEEEGVQLKDRKRPMGKPFLQCFSGSDAITWMMKNGVHRREAMVALTEWMNDGLFTQVAGPPSSSSRLFVDSGKALYKFSGRENDMDAETLYGFKVEPHLKLHSVSHNFLAERFNKPMWCDYCGDLIKGVVGKQGFQCHNTQCGYVVHKKCMQDALNICCGKREELQRQGLSLENSEAAMAALNQLYF